MPIIKWSGMYLWINIVPLQGNRVWTIGEPIIMVPFTFLGSLISNIHVRGYGARLQKQEHFSKKEFLCISLRGQVQRSS